MGNLHCYLNKMSLEKKGQKEQLVTVKRLAEKGYENCQLFNTFCVKKMQ